ncbi:NmrA family NAD(P)-binding protein [Mycobacterium sp. ML3]
MAKPTIAVTGATGKTGGAVVNQLLPMGFPVRALVRTHDGRAEALRRAGAEVVVADLFDPDQLLDALRGSSRAYYLAPFHPHALQSAVAFALSAREAGLEAIVQMSQWTSHRSHPVNLTRQTWLMDHLFAGLPGIAHTIVNPGMFADNFLRTIDFAALLGIYPVLSGDGRAAPVSNEDIARAVVAVLADPDRHAGKTYRPSGPQLLSATQMATVVAKVVGHSVIPVPLPYALFTKVARRQGVDPLSVTAFLRYLEGDMKAGVFEFDGGVTDVLEDLTGIPAESFETTARRYAALPFARQTAANRLKALLKFLATPFLPGYNLSRLDRQWDMPVPPNPSLGIEDARWRDEHHRMMQQPSAPARQIS